MRRLIRADRDRGAAAVLTAILVPVLLGASALAVDTGNWYRVVQNVQRAADAAALAGVTYLPGNLSLARSTALAVAANNGYTNDATTTVDPEPVPGQPSQLTVTITTVVNNTFGRILGVDTETIRRSSTATYQAPLPLGSPCNEFGDGPEPLLAAANPRSSNCARSGKFWANVGSPKALKTYGDAYQDGNCAGGGDNCSSGNTDYSTNGYFYSITLSAPVTNLTVQAFDPAFVGVGDLCGTNFGTAATAAVNAKNQYNYDASARAYREDPALYASGQGGAYCTGDQLYGDSGGGQPPDTTFTIRQPAVTSSLNDPMTFPVVAGCTQTFTGYSGDLYTAIDQYTQVAGAVQYAAGRPVVSPTYRDSVAKAFRQWVTLCTFPGTVAAGTYFVQVQTNAAGDNPSGDGHNRFALRAFGASASDNTSIAISGLTTMAMYANLQSARTTFYLTRVPPGAGGQILDVRLYDIGDSSQPGTVTVVPPADSNVGGSFTGCVGSGPTSGPLTGCAIVANSSYNGRWEQISVPIPAGYSCDQSSATGCWVTLTYDYGSGQPSDTTSWQASLEGSPVRIIQ